MTYQHTQPGWVLLAAGAAPTLVAGIVLVPSNVMLAGVLLAVTALLVLLFGWLRVTVDDDGVRLAFGAGIVRRTFRCEQIVACQPVRNKWFHGFGVRVIPNGMLYNASGLDAVELTLTSGQRVRIGTDDPAGLAAAIGDRARVARTPFDAPLASLAPSGLVGAVVLAVVVALGSAGLVIWYGQRPIEASVSGGALAVQGAGYSTRVAIADVRDATLVDALPAIRRKVNGYSFGGRLRGRFRADDLGDVMVFIDRRTPPFLIVRSSQTTVIVNGETPDATRQLRDALVAARH